MGAAVCDPRAQVVGSFGGLINGRPVQLCVQEKEREEKRVRTLAQSGSEDLCRCWACGGLAGVSMSGWCTCVCMCMRVCVCCLAVCVSVLHMCVCALL